MSEARPALAYFHQDVLMDAMLDAVGVNLLTLADVDGGKSYLRARAACHGCAVKDECKGWLEMQDADEPAGRAQPQPFCPNAPLFSGLQD